jgi:hypothetical protein
MGLDTYAFDGKNQAPDSNFDGISLCGGMFSGSGSSFRGKVYNSFVNWVTNDQVDLYTERNSSDEVTLLYNAIDEFLLGGTSEELQDALDELHNNGDIEYHYKIDEIRDLHKFMKVCVDNNYTLVGWW